MSKLVERLNSLIDSDIYLPTVYGDTICDAADEIESLEQCIRDMCNHYPTGYFLKRHPEHREIIERLTNEH